MSRLMSTPGWARCKFDEQRSGFKIRFNLEALKHRVCMRPGYQLDRWFGALMKEPNHPYHCISLCAGKNEPAILLFVSFWNSGVC